MRLLRAALAGFVALFAGLAMILALSIGIAVGGAQTAATIYEGALLIDGNGGSPVENSAFVVEGGRFTQVGRVGQLKPPAGATRVNLAGKTVIPALIDTQDRKSVV